MDPPRQVPAGASATSSAPQSQTKSNSKPRRPYNNKHGKRGPAPGPSRQPNPQFRPNYLSQSKSTPFAQQYKIKPDIAAKFQHRPNIRSPQPVPSSSSLKFSDSGNLRQRSQSLGTLDGSGSSSLEFFGRSGGGGGPVPDPGAGGDAWATLGYLSRNRTGSGYELENKSQDRDTSWTHTQFEPKFEEQHGQEMSTSGTDTSGPAQRTRSFNPTNTSRKSQDKFARIVGNNSVQQYPKPSKSNGSGFPDSTIDPETITQYSLRLASISLEIEEVCTHEAAGYGVRLISELKKSMLYIRSLEWSGNVEQLLQVLKRCIMAKHRVFKNFYFGNNGGVSLNGPGIGCGGMKIPNSHFRKIFQLGHPLAQDLLTFAQLAVDILDMILKLIPIKEAYSYFVSLMKRPLRFGVTDYDIQYIIEAEYKWAYSPELLYNILELTGDSITKAKFMLNLGETKAIAHRHVPHTSFSAHVVGALENLAKFLLSTIHSPTRRFKHDKMYETLKTVAQVTPFIRMDTNLFEILTDFALEKITEQPATYPRGPILSMLQSILGTEWNKSGRVLERIYTLPRDQQYGINRMLGLSVHYLHNWLIFVLGGRSPESDYYVGRTELAALDVKLISTFARYHFNTFIQEFGPCFKGVKEILDISVRLEKDVYSMISLTQPHLLCGNPSIYDEKLSLLLAPCLETIGFFQTLIYGLGDYFKSGADPDSRGSVELIDAVEYYLYKSTGIANTDCSLLAIGIVDSFACISESLYNILDDGVQRHIIVSALGFCRDGRLDVRAKAGRVLAHLLEFESCEQFICDGMDTINFNYSHGDLNVRTPYAWAMGNLAQSLSINYPTSIPGNRGIEFIQSLYKLSMRMCIDHPKIRYNGNRALGCLLKWFPDKYMDDFPNFETFVGNGIELLSEQVASGNEFKARWNACYALGNAVTNAGLTNRLGSKIIEPALKSFIKGLTKSENYKERSNCIKGLCKVGQRDQFGDYYWVIWDSLFQSYHRELPNLVSKNTGRGGGGGGNYGNPSLTEKFVTDIANGIMYLTSFLTLEDLHKLEELILENTENLKQIFTVAEEIEGGGDKLHIPLEATNRLQSLTAQLHSGSQNYPKGTKDTLDLLRQVMPKPVSTTAQQEAMDEEFKKSVIIVESEEKELVTV